MHIWVGTKNKAKVKAVEMVFPSAEIFSVHTPSGVSEQPFSDEETKKGAIYRATQSLQTNRDTYSIGIGLEGGVMESEGTLFICNWGALATSTEDLFVASGARIPLPKKVADELYAGKELGPVMQWFSKKENVRHKEGAIGIFTNGLINRSTMFSHIIYMLKGQWEYRSIL